MGAYMFILNNAIDLNTFLAYEMPTCRGPQVIMAFCAMCVLYFRVLFLSPANFYDFDKFVFQKSELSTAGYVKTALLVSRPEQEL